MDMNPQIVLRLAAFVCFALCLVLAFLAGMFYRRDRIPQVKADLAGKVRLSSNAQADLSGRSFKQLRAMHKREDQALREKESSTESGSLPSTAPADLAAQEESGVSGSTKKESAAISTAPAFSAAPVSRSVLQTRVAEQGADFVVTKSIVRLAATELVEIG